MTDQLPSKERCTCSMGSAEYRHHALTCPVFVVGAACAALQARIDALMIEHCPDEMTQEQFDNWAAHQRAAQPSQGVPSKEWGVTEAFKTLELVTSGSSAAVGAMSYLRRHIDRLQALLELETGALEQVCNDLDSARTIERLRTTLRGVQSCSTCEACRGAAQRALGEKA